MRVRETRLQMRWQKVDVFLLLFFPLYLLYVGNGFHSATGDNAASRILPDVILTEGTLDLSGRPGYLPNLVHYSAIEVGDSILPSFPIGTALLAVPHRLVAYAGARDERGVALLDRWEKHFSALTIAASACLLFLGVRRRYGERAALGAAIVFALATTAFSSASQGMWSFTGELFFVCLALWMILPDPSRGRGVAGHLSQVLAGGALGAAFLCRPTALVILIVLSAVLWVENRERAWLFAIAGATSVGICAIWQWWTFGHALGAYGLMNSGASVWGGDLVVSLLGTLLSPGRGVVIYAPFLIVLALSMPALSRAGLLDRWWKGSILLIVFFWLLTSSYYKWWGGHSIGPRLLTEIAPFIALATVPMWRGQVILTWQRRLFISAVGIAVVIQLMAAYNRSAGWWTGEVGVTPYNMRPLWFWRDGQLHAILKWRWHYNPLAEPMRPYERTKMFAVGVDPSLIERVDLRSVANTRYDIPMRVGDSGSFGLGVLPRIEPLSLNSDRAWFHFAPLGSANAVTNCGIEEPVRIPLPRGRHRLFRALLVARVDDDESVGQSAALQTSPRIVGTWRTESPDWLSRRNHIVLEREVWDIRPKKRVRLIHPDRIYLGLATLPDVLVWSQGPLEQPTGRSKKNPRSLILEPPPDDEGCVTLLALTLATPEWRGAQAGERS